MCKSQCVVVCVNHGVGGCVCKSCCMVRVSFKVRVRIRVKVRVRVSISVRVG